MNHKMSKPLFSCFDRFKKPAYEMAKIPYIVPMTAKEVLNDNELNAMYSSKDYIIEEKFDGTRALLYLYSRKGREKAFREWVTSTLEMPEKVADFVCFSGVKSIRNFLFKIFSGAESLTSDVITSGNVTLHFPNVLFHDGSTAFFREGVFHLKEHGISYEFPSSSIVELMQVAFVMGVYHPKETFIRCFSRRISKKTDWFVENTDLLPKIRDCVFPECLDGTIIDGEMFIPGRPFKDVSSTLNCKWDKAIERQNEIGDIVFHAFDCIQFEGTFIDDSDLLTRKKYLEQVLDMVNSPLIKPVSYFLCGEYSCNCEKYLPKALSYMHLYPKDMEARYPYAYDELEGYKKGKVLFSPKAYYDMIVINGGEGVMLKDIHGTYKQKRGREYQKVKKVLTRDVIILGFDNPTKEYTGKFANKNECYKEWRYWECYGRKYDTHYEEDFNFIKEHLSDAIPVTQYYYRNQVGNIRYGVVVKEEDVKNLPWKAKKESYSYAEGYYIVPIGDCGGLTEIDRVSFTMDKHSYEGKVVEVMANEVFSETGKMRHPRFLRMRDDKDWKDCLWEIHIGG